MNLHDLTTAKGKREAARGPLRVAIEFGIDLIKHPKMKRDSSGKKPFRLDWKCWNLRWVSIGQRMWNSEIS